MDEAYSGEVAKQLKDTAYYTRVITHTPIESQHSAAALDAQSAIGFAGAMAMTKTLEHDNPGELCKDMQSMLVSAVRMTESALRLFEVSGRRGFKDELHLRIIHSMIAPLILYKPMCMFGDDPRALKQRQQLHDRSFQRIIRVIRDIQQNPIEGQVSNWRGMLHEATTIAVLNSTNNPNAIAMPVLEADDIMRCTDIAYITYENGVGFTRYIQATSSNHKKSYALPPYQTHITGGDLENTGRHTMPEWLTTARLFAFITPTEGLSAGKQSLSRHLVRTLAESLHKRVQQESTPFMLAP